MAHEAERAFEFTICRDGGKSPSSGWTQVMEKEYGFKPGFVMKMPTTKEEVEKTREEWMKKTQEQQR